MGREQAEKPGPSGRFWSPMAIQASVSARYISRGAPSGIFSENTYMPPLKCDVHVSPRRKPHTVHAPHTQGHPPKTAGSYLQKYPQYCYSEVCRYCGSAAHAHAPARHASSMGSSSSSSPSSSSPPSSSFSSSLLSSGAAWPPNSSMQRSGSPDASWKYRGGSQ